MEHLPTIKRPLEDVRCCDGDSVTLETLIDAPKSSIIRWEKQAKVVKEGGDIVSEWDGECARLHIREVYPEDEGEYSCIVSNDLGKAVTSATLVVEMADDKENDVTIQMEHRPDLSRRTTPSRTTTPSRFSRSPSRPFQPHRKTPEPYQRSKVKRAQRPKFYYIPHDRIVEEGDTVSFQCAVKGHPKPIATWDKDSKKIIPGGRINVEETGEIRYLEIPKVTQQDSGLYRVTIDNDMGREQATARLDVIKATTNRSIGTVRNWNSAPRTTPRFTRTMPSSVVRDGEKLNLTTEFRGSPRPQAKWYRNGELLPPSKEYCQKSDAKKASLEIPEVAECDAGNYTCVLINSAGKAKTSCQVTVEQTEIIGGQPPTFIQKLKEITATEGDPLELTVKIKGSEPLKVVWVKNDRELRNHEQTERNIDSHRECSLVIRDSFPQDCGLYFCEAFNAFGHAVTYAKVTVTDPYEPPPSAPKLIGSLSALTVDEGEAAQFRVRVIGYPDPEVAWYLEGRELKETNRFQIRTECPEEGDGILHCLRILPALVVDSGTLSVLIENSHGSEAVHTTFQVQPRSYAPKKALKVTPKAKVNNRPLSPKPIGKSNSPAHKSRTKTLLEMSKHNSQDSAYASGRSSSLSTDQDSESLSIIGEVDAKPEPRESPLGQCPSTECYEEAGEECGAVIVSGPNDVIALKKQSATLSATFSGIPSPEVIWYKRDKIIESGGRYTIKKGKIVTSLTISDVTFDDCDKYTLKVQNSLSAHSAFASLAVEGVPEPPAGTPNLSEVTSRSVTLSWYGPAYDGGRIITGYRVEARAVGTLNWYTLVQSCHSTSFKIEELEPRTQYEFRVFAINDHGMSSPSQTSSPITLQKACEDGYSSENDGHYSEPQSWAAVELQSGDKFDELFELHEEVGKGRFGIVYKVSEKSGGNKRAAKVIKSLKSEDRLKVQAEICIMNSLRHSRLLQLLAAYERKKDFVMILEYISGGELFERVVADDFTLTERDCILFIRQICEGVNYMHQNSIVHLDLKPENILCVKRTSHKIKLIDFGLARKLDPKEPCRVLFGTPEFVAPEVISYEPISFASDMWSVGVICYVLLSGLSPFMGENDAETFSNITRAEFDFDDESFDAISEDAKNFINSLLDKRKENRPSAAECLTGGWLTQTDETMKDVILSTDKLKRFIIRRKWQKTGNAILALGRMTNLSHLRNSSPTRLSTLSESNSSKSPATSVPSSVSESSSSSTIAKTPSISSEATTVVLNQSFQSNSTPHSSSPNKTSNSIVNERSDSGISEWSECSTVGGEERSSRLCSTSSVSSLNSCNSQAHAPNGHSTSDRKPPALSWQYSVDSAMDDEEAISKNGYPSPLRKPSRETLHPVQEITPSSMHETHSRI